MSGWFLLLGIGFNDRLITPMSDRLTRDLMASTTVPLVMENVTAAPGATAPDHATSRRASIRSIWSVFEPGVPICSRSSGGR